jgi:hypothetical protein
MWGELLGLALLVSLNPVLLGFILLVISRPRPVQNLLAFWVGCLIVNVPAYLVSLMVLHLVPTSHLLREIWPPRIRVHRQTPSTWHRCAGVVDRRTDGISLVAASAGERARTGRHGRQHPGPGAGLEYTDR